MPLAAVGGSVRLFFFSVYNTACCCTCCDVRCGYMCCNKSRVICHIYKRQLIINIIVDTSASPGHYLQLKAGHRSTLRTCVFAFWHRASVYVRAIVCVLSTHLRGDESSTCVCLRLREQCLRSEITPVARVTHFLLLRFVAGNMDVNTLASKRSELIRKRSDCSNAPRNPQQVDLCVLASFSCRVYVETYGRNVRHVAGLTHSIRVFFVFPFLDDTKLRRRVHIMPEVPHINREHNHDRVCEQN